MSWLWETEVKFGTLCCSHTSNFWRLYKADTCFPPSTGLRRDGTWKFIVLTGTESVHEIPRHNIDGRESSLIGTVKSSFSKLRHLTMTLHPSIAKSVSLVSRYAKGIWLSFSSNWIVSCIQQIVLFLLCSSVSDTGSKIIKSTIKLLFVIFKKSQTVDTRGAVYGVSGTVSFRGVTFLSRDPVCPAQGVAR